MLFSGSAIKEPRVCLKCGLTLSLVEKTICLRCQHLGINEEEELAIMKHWFPEEYKKLKLKLKWKN